LGTPVGLVGACDSREGADVGPGGATLLRGGEVDQRSALRDLRGWSARGGCRLRIGRRRRFVGRCYRRSSVVVGAEVEEGPAPEVGVLGGGGRLRFGLGLGFGLGRVVRLEVEQR